MRGCHNPPCVREHGCSAPQLFGSGPARRPIVSRETRNQLKKNRTNHTTPKTNGSNKYHRQDYQWAETRRFTSSKGHLTWPSLSKRCADLFEMSKAAKFTYLDDEGDRITISSDIELEEAIAIALASEPSVLRLTIAPSVESKSTGSSADVAMSDAATDPDVKKTVDAGTHAKPTTADASTTGTAAGAAPPGSPEFQPSGMPSEYHALFQSLARQLPGLAAQLPEAVRALLPHAELDLAATLAATHAANAASAASAAAANATNAANANAANAANAASTGTANAATMPDVPMPEGFAPAVGYHQGVRCDRTGQCPIQGNRFHLVGHNYDLCEAEYNKLTDNEKPLYVKIPPPSAAQVHTMGGGGANQSSSNESSNDASSIGIHPGVECDRSGMCPIVGVRYNLKGHDYDLCQVRWSRRSAFLPEKLLAIASPACALDMPHSSTSLVRL